MNRMYSIREVLTAGVIGALSVASVGCAPANGAEADDLQGVSASPIERARARSPMPNAEQELILEGDASDNAAGPGVNYVPEGSFIAYRHDWGDGKGSLVLNLNWGDVHSWSHVFVSASEGHMGAAPYTVENVVPWEGGVSIRMYVGWSEPIRLYVDYLLVNY